MANPMRRSDVLQREVGDDMMLYDVTGRAIHVLNETAQFIWDRCDGEHDLDAMISEAAEAYQAAEDEIRADIEETLDTFRNLGVIIE